MDSGFRRKRLLLLLSSRNRRRRYPGSPPTGGFLKRSRASARTPLAREIADIFRRDFVAPENSAMTVVGPRRGKRDYDSRISTRK